jgi:mRNA interferase HicA
MTSAQFKRWLARQGCTFEPGKGGHIFVRLNGRISVMPMHGSNRELSTGTVFKITKDLGLTQK